jgi:hypothetical protein
MALQMTVDVPGMTRDQYEGLVFPVTDEVRRAPGFILHVGFPTESGWGVTEVWESRETFDRWYEAKVRPNLGPGANPNLVFHELHNVITR